MRMKNTTQRRLEKLLLGLVLLAFIIPQAGCGDKEPVSGSDVYLDTQCDITVYGMRQSQAEEIITGAFEEIERYDALMSRTVQGSDVDRVNRASGDMVIVDSSVAEAIAAGLEAGAYSGGDFDISIGRVTALWDFKSADPEVPSEEELADAVATVNYKDVSVHGNEITMKNPDAELDLGGIAKRSGRPARGIASSGPAYVTPTSGGRSGRPVTPYGDPLPARPGHPLHPGK